MGWPDPPLPWVTSISSNSKCWLLLPIVFWIQAPSLTPFYLQILFHYVWVLPGKRPCFMILNSVGHRIRDLCIKLAEKQDFWGRGVNGSGRKERKIINNKEAGEIYEVVWYIEVLVFIITVTFLHPIPSRSQHGSWESGNSFKATPPQLVFFLRILCWKWEAQVESCEGKKTNTPGLGRAEVVGPNWNRLTRA